MYDSLAQSALTQLDDLTGTELEAAETALFRQAIMESVRATMWLGKTARAEDVYKRQVRLRLMMAGVPDDAGWREGGRIVEDDAVARYGAVRAWERVRSVRGLKVSPETKPLTPRGETAVAAEFEAEMFYCD